MPMIIKGNMKIVVTKWGYKNYGIYLFEEPNIYIKVATFNSDEGADRFIEYLTKMFDIEEKENE